MEMIDNIVKYASAASDYASSGADALKKFHYAIYGANPQAGFVDLDFLGQLVGPGDNILPDTDSENRLSNVNSELSDDLWAQSIGIPPGSRYNLDYKTLIDDASKRRDLDFL